MAMKDNQLITFMMHICHIPCNIQSFFSVSIKLASLKSHWDKSLGASLGDISPKISFVTKALRKNLYVVTDQIFYLHFCTSYFSIILKVVFNHVLSLSMQGMQIGPFCFGIIFSPLNKFAISH